MPDQPHRPVFDDRDIAVLALFDYADRRRLGDNPRDGSVPLDELRALARAQLGISEDQTTNSLIRLVADGRLERPRRAWYRKKTD